MRLVAVDLSRNVFREPCTFGARAIAVHARIVASTLIDVVTDMALVGLHHVPAETCDHRETHALEHQLPVEAALVAAVPAFDRLEHATLVPQVREVERESSVGVGEAAVHESVRKWRVAVDVFVQVGRAEVRIGDAVRRRLQPAERCIRRHSMPPISTPESCATPANPPARNGVTHGTVATPAPPFNAVQTKS